MLAAVARWVLLWLGVYAATEGGGLSALDYTRSWLFAAIGAVAMDGLVAGLLVQTLYRVRPQLEPAARENAIPPHQRSMSRRLLSVIVPLTFATFLALFAAVTASAVNEATNQAAGEMTKSAQSAAEMVPLLFTTGQELLARVAAAEPLRSADPSVREQALAENLRAGAYGPFFSQLILVEGQGASPTYLYYPQDTLPSQLGAEEERLLQRALEFGSPERSHVFQLDDERLISFLVPVESADGGRSAVLIGRCQLDVNPMYRDLLAFLEASGSGEPGYILDDQGMVAFRPEGSSFLPAQSEPRCNPVQNLYPRVRELVRGRMCEDLAPDGTRRLIYYLPIPALYNWTVVVTHPYADVLDRATRISGRLPAILMVVVGTMALAVALSTNHLTRRLQWLVAAARGIAAGDLDNQVLVREGDEVAQLGRAFEQMRLSLKDRLEELSLLLRVSQAVSSNLDANVSVPTILKGALEATDARVARVVLLDERADPEQVIAPDSVPSTVTPLDRALARLGQGERPRPIEDIQQVRGLLDPSLVDPGIKALATVPMHSKERQIGVMWLGYGEVHVFSDTEIDLLSTLVSQAAVAVENARLFETAEGERRRLAAILASTADAVIVTDRAERVLWMNPAAAGIFGTDATAVQNMPAARALHESKIVQVLTTSLEDGVSLADEIPLPDGRTLFANVSNIVSGDGQALGRVAVLRDITYLKELDELKSEFVSTVSHDLRRPLTTIRGYTSMLPTAGQLTSMQKVYVNKILGSIDQMTQLVITLLDLGRIEAGVNLLCEPCRLDRIAIDVVGGIRSQIKAKGLTLRVERAGKAPVVAGDAPLLGRVISNLLDNAIKYTPEGGRITVRWQTRGKTVLFSVSDTGVGIAKADQVRLFKKFARIERRETPHVRGWGLGLAIVKSIVERHNGRVWVDSALRQGSTFYVELPLIAEQGSEPTDS
jgi:PAS domain S-box-containing protein